LEIKLNPSKKTMAFCVVSHEDISLAKSKALDSLIKGAKLVVSVPRLLLKETSQLPFEIKKDGTRVYEDQTSNICRICGNVVLESHMEAHMAEIHGKNKPKNVDTLLSNSFNKFEGSRQKKAVIYVTNQYLNTK
jgi:hypothetical protein